MEDRLDLLIVMESPDMEDAKSGYLLSSNDYWKYKFILNELSMKYMITSWVTYVPMNQEGRFRKFDEVDYKEGLNNYIETVTKYRPKVILFASRILTEFYMGQSMFDKMRDKPINRMINGEVYKIMATYSFFAGVGNERIEKLINDDIVDAYRWAVSDKPENNKYVTKDLSFEQFKIIARKIIEDPKIEYVSYDTESNTLDPAIPGSKITSFSFSVDGLIGYNRYMYHPEHPEITDEMRQETIDIMKEMLTKKKVIVHHAKHEYRLCKYLWGFVPNITDDTMYLANTVYLTYPGMSFGLKYLSGRLLAMKPWEHITHRFSDLFKKMNRYKVIDEDRISQLCEDYDDLGVKPDEVRRFRDILKDPNYYIKHSESDSGADVFYWMIPERYLSEYAGYDAIAPLLLREKMIGIVEADKGLSEVYDRLMNAADSFSNMELGGFNIVDADYWKERYVEEYNKYIDEVKELQVVKDYEEAKGTELLLSSSSQLADFLHNFLKMPVVARTAKGAPSVSADALKTLMDRYQDDPTFSTLLNCIFKQRKFKKIISTYFDGLSKFYRIGVGFDGDRCKFFEGCENNIVCRPQYSLHTVATGRVASSDPSLHTMPTKSEAKMAFRSPWYDKGGLMVFSDYNAAEVRLLASVCETYFGDSTLADAFRAGHDLHYYTASRIFAKPIEEITKDERRASKSFTFAVLYGSGMESVAESTGRTLDEVKKLFSFYYDSFPGIKKFIDYQHKFVKEHGYIRSPSGRIKWLMEALHCTNQGEINAALRKAQNSPIQGSASDLGVIAINEFYRQRKLLGLNSYLVGMIHDACYTCCYPNELIETIKLMKYSMKDHLEENYHWIACPLGVDIEISGDGGINEGCDVKEAEFLEDGKALLHIKGKQSIMMDVIDRISMAYEILENELVDSYEDTIEDAGIGVISLTQNGTFTFEERKLIIRKLVPTNFPPLPERKLPPL